MLTFFWLMLIFHRRHHNLHHPRHLHQPQQHQLNRRGQLVYDVALPEELWSPYHFP